MSMPFAGMGLVFSIVYVWAKENAEEEVNFVFNLARFKVSCSCRAFEYRLVNLKG
jgi:hypothetical protein